ncbi:hypothetical protein DFH27DRAFT_606777 [Peziza echinospora]|nr:hypothetical protein DFH27DRAFT_606777 [Peziza echinospora]
MPSNKKKQQPPRAITPPPSTNPLPIASQQKKDIPAAEAPPPKVHRDWKAVEKHPLWKLSGEKYYCVVRGRKPGVYATPDEAFEQTHGFKGNLMKSFTRLLDAKRYMNHEFGEEEPEMDEQEHDKEEAVSKTVEKGSAGVNRNIASKAEAGTPAGKSGTAISAGNLDIDDAWDEDFEGPKLHGQGWDADNLGQDVVHEGASKDGSREWKTATKKVKERKPKPERRRNPEYRRDGEGDAGSGRGGRSSRAQPQDNPENDFQWGAEPDDHAGHMQESGHGQLDDPMPRVSRVSRDDWASQLEETVNSSVKVGDSDQVMILEQGDEVQEDWDSELMVSGANLPRFGSRDQSQELYEDMSSFLDLNECEEEAGGEEAWLADGSSLDLEDNLGEDTLE